MNDLKIVRGTDVTLLIDDEPLFGMTDFHAEMKAKNHRIYEYLSDKPVATVAGSPGFTIRLSVMTLFCDQFPRNRSFSLTVRMDGMEYVYEGCRLVSTSSEVKGASHGTQVLTIESERMLDRVMEDE